MHCCVFVIHIFCFLVSPGNGLETNPLVKIESEGFQDTLTYAYLKLTACHASKPFTFCMGRKASVLSAVALNLVFSKMILFYSAKVWAGGGDDVIWRKTAG